MSDYIKRKSIVNKIKKASAVLFAGSVAALVANCEPSLAYITTATLGGAASYIASLDEQYCDWMIACDIRNKKMKQKREEREQAYKLVRDAISEFIFRDDISRNDFWDKLGENLSNPDNYPDSFKKL
ncbi:MAG: hypothetical protein U9R08_06695 [Nanoarchaeota archaeon]|nr:hypothetical protein [Nanoarchaeota archaeon]